MPQSEYRTFEALQLASGLLTDSLKKREKLRTDFRHVAESNAIFHQLQCGLCLEVTPEGALSFWTLWGDWNACLAHLPLDLDFASIKGLTIKPFEPNIDNLILPFNSMVFAVLQTNHLVLPYPQLRPVNEYRAPREIKQNWHELASLHRARYCHP